MATPSAIPANAPRDTVQLIHRVTREKRSLWYQLSVLQQPERARACGAGSKGKSIILPHAGDSRRQDRTSFPFYTRRD